MKSAGVVVGGVGGQAKTDLSKGRQTVTNISGQQTVVIVTFHYCCCCHTLVLGPTIRGAERQFLSITCIDSISVLVCAR